MPELKLQRQWQNQLDLICLQFAEIEKNLKHGNKIR